MQFLTFYTPDRPASGPPGPEQTAKMSKLVDDMTKAGALITRGMFLPSATGTRVHLSNSQFTVMDGTSERGDVGFALLEANLRKDAIELVKTFLKIAGDGTCEVRQLMGPPPK